MIYDQRVYECVMDVHGEDPSDTDTLWSYANKHADQIPTLYAIVDGKLERIALDRTSSKKFKNALRRNGPRSGLVVTMFRPSDKVKATDEDPHRMFMTDLAITLRVLTAIAPDADTDAKAEADARRLTSLSWLPFVPKRARTKGAKELKVFGVELGGVGFAIGSKWDHAIDESRVDEETLDSTVRTVLEALARLHARGLMHGNVRMDSVSQGKLIDWSATMTFDEARRLFAKSKTPRNLASPAAWSSWGGTLGCGDDHARVLHRILHAKIVKRSSVFRTPRFQALVDGAYDSYVGWKETGGQRALAAVPMPSHDLYNFALVVAGLALSPGADLAQQALDRVLAFAARLTHYGAPDYAGGDAGSALAAWESMNR